MEKGYRNYYLISLAVLLALSAYPIIFGAQMVVTYLSNGILQPGEYAKGVIPYVSICLSLIIVAAFHPLLTKLKKFQFAITAILALGLFIGIELAFESIKVNTRGIVSLSSSQQTDTIDVWQSALCYASPDAIKAQRIRIQQAQSSIGSFDYFSANTPYKIHYFLVSMVIILLVVSILHGFGKRAKSKSSSNINALVLQLVSVAVLVGLCIFATLTAFFRDTSPVLQPVPAVLTSLFFIVLGVSAGVFAGSFLLKKKRVLSVIIPALVSIAVCSLMYLGEFILMGGTFYRFGSSWLFTGLPWLVLAPVDMVVILLSGLITAGIFILVRKDSKVSPPGARAEA